MFVAHGRVNGKQVNITIGPYGQLTEHEARDRARRLLQRMREGSDPRDERKHDDAMRITLRDVADSYTSRVGKLKASSVAQIERHVTTTPALWERKPIVSITEEACRKRYRELMTKGLRGKVTAHDLRRTVTTIGIANCGIDFYKVELLTGHLPTTVTARPYLETERLGYLYPEAQRIADYIEEQAAKANGANVVPLHA